jgi:hypothetical protein
LSWIEGEKVKKVWSALKDYGSSFLYCVCNNKPGCVSKESRFYNKTLAGKARRGGLMTTTLQDKINKVAYELYEKNGSQKGNELLNWLAAEKIVLFQHMISPKINGEAVALIDYRPMHSAEPNKPTSDNYKSQSRKTGRKKVPKEIRAGL